jgi:peptidase E
MTKYILAGGYLYKAADKGKAFLEELLKDVENRPVKVLDCLFAIPSDAWAKKFEEDQLFFSQHVSGYELVLADPNKFTEQVKSADVVFFRGGDTMPLLEVLRKDLSWIKELEGKTLAGTSAGAEAIAKYFYNIDHNILEEGLGLLPIKLISHWRSDYNAPNVDWDGALNDLEKYKEDLEIVTLKEGEFKVVLL